MTPAPLTGSARNTSPFGASAMKRANWSVSANTFTAKPGGVFTWWPADAGTTRVDFRNHGVSNGAGSVCSDNASASATARLSISVNIVDSAAAAGADFSPARAGAPPVRGKGACSHPPEVRTQHEPSFRPDQADSGRYGKKVSMPRTITSATSLDNLKKEAKRWLKALREGDAEARTRLERAYPAPARPVLRDMQHALAREHGYESWIALKEAVEKPAHDRVVGDLVLAFNGKDEAALQRMNDHYKRLFTFEDLWAEVWRRTYSFRQRSSRTTDKSLHLDEAQMLVAQNAGFGSWKALTDAVVTGAPPVPPYAVDEAEQKIGPIRILNQHEWDDLIAVMKERRRTAFNPKGLR